MSFKQNNKQASVLAENPSSSFSSFSSAASATSVGTSRSGGSRLLFGEIDSSSERSDTCASVCSLVLSDSSTFLRFWLSDNCRETLISNLPKRELATVRQVCHDFSVRAAPALFEDLSITFRTSTFTKPARLAALDRLGFHVKTLTFTLPHTHETALPPLIEPDTGEELSFTYTPQVHPPQRDRPKYGDEGTTAILARQYPPLFHAATNVSAFIRGFSAFHNLSHLNIACPGYEVLQRSRRSTVDFALISLRIAIERNSLNSLDTLTLNPIHPSGILHLSPLLGYGATPASGRRWSRIRHLTIHADSPAVFSGTAGQADHVRLLHTYLGNFQRSLQSFEFNWRGNTGPLPFGCVAERLNTSQHPSARDNSARPNSNRTLHFPLLSQLSLENTSAKASDIASFVEQHKSTIEELDLQSIDLIEGTWEEALAPLEPSGKLDRSETSWEGMADIPIMLAPLEREITADDKALPRVPAVRAGNRVEIGTRKGVRSSSWFAGKRSSPRGAKRVRDGFAGCEGHLRKVLMGNFGLGFWNP